MSRSRSASVLVALVAACGGTATSSLGPAGSRFDDGTGQLAAQSVRLDVGEDGTIERTADVRRYNDEGDPYYPSYGGYGYGGCGYGGYGYGGCYGGFGYGGFGVGVGYGPPAPPPPPYDGSGVYDGGSILGTVRWKADGGVVWPADCAEVRVARAGTAVGGAVVYLEGVKAGRALPYAASVVRTGGVLAVDGCALRPAVQIVNPLPSQLVIENGDRRAARLTSEHAGMSTIVDLDPGARLAVPVERVGEMMVSDGTRAPAWVIGQAHPYYVVTDGDGRFAIDEIPPGTYELVIWVPPMAARVGADGPVWTAPTVDRVRVTVPKHAVARVDASLVPGR